MWTYRNAVYDLRMKATQTAMAITLPTGKSPELEQEPASRGIKGVSLLITLQAPHVSIISPIIFIFLYILKISLIFAKYCCFTFQNEQNGNIMVPCVQEVVTPIYKVTHYIN